MGRGDVMHRHVPRRAELDTLSTVFRYIGCIVVAALVSATLVATGRLVVIGSPFWDMLAGSFLSQALAGLALAPMLILWARAGRDGLRLPARPARLVEAVMLAAAFLLLAWLRLSTPEINSAELALLHYALVPLLIWAAVRFGPRGVQSALSLVILVSLAVSYNGAAPSSGTGVLTLQTLLFTVGIPLFALAALMEERQVARAQLERSTERYHAVVTSLPHGAVLLFGPDLRHVLADGQQLLLLGLSKENVEGKTPHECFPPGLATLLQPHYHAALAAGTDIHWM